MGDGETVGAVVVAAAALPGAAPEEAEGVPEPDGEALSVEVALGAAGSSAPTAAVVPAVPAMAVSTSTIAVVQPIPARLRFIRVIPATPRGPGSRPSRRHLATRARVCHDQRMLRHRDPDRRRWPQSRVEVPGTRHVRSRHMSSTPRRRSLRPPSVESAQGPRMSVRRVMGTETEFGISVTGQPLANPMVASSRVVNAYAGVDPAGPAGALGLRGGVAAARRPRLRHVARGGRPEPAHRRGPRPGQRDPHQRRPAVRRPRAPRVLHARSARTRATSCSGTRRGSRSGSTPAGSPSTPGEGDLVLYKNNTDNKGASYGSHENYLMRRSTPFADIVRHLTPFFVSRQVVCGAGRVGIGQDGRERRLPDQPARRLLRGRGRARDHPQAADHQHPRRAARRPGEVPAAARDHRRRQPRRGLDVPQGRHHRAGAVDDRGPVPLRRPERPAAGGRASTRSRTTRRSTTCSSSPTGAS